MSRELTIINLCRFRPQLGVAVLNVETKAVLFDQTIAFGGEPGSFIIPPGVTTIALVATNGAQSGSFSASEPGIWSIGPTSGTQECVFSRILSTPPVSSSSVILRSPCRTTVQVDGKTVTLAAEAEQTIPLPASRFLVLQHGSKLLLTGPGAITLSCTGFVLQGPRLRLQSPCLNAVVVTAGSRTATVTLPAGHIVPVVNLPPGTTVTIQASGGTVVATIPRA